MASDPTYVQSEIDGNPVWALAWTISQIVDDKAPIGWSRHIPTAQCLLAHYDIKRKESA